MHNSFYYALRPVIPRALQVWTRRRLALRTARRSPHWPIWEHAIEAPADWRGWPGGKRFALVLTHDVELSVGVSRCERVAELEEERGFRSAFAFVPLRYRTPDRLRQTLRASGFQIMVHDLYHDGKLFRDRKTFEERCPRINDVLRQWGARAFASGAMHHNLTWISELDIDSDISTFDVDPFEPQPCGVGRIFPYYVQPPRRERPGFVELPYTMPQDFTLFVLLQERSIALWRKKLDWIAEKGGMALIKTHPDYMSFSAADERAHCYPFSLYTELLDYMNSRYGGEFWLANPAEMARFWRGLRAFQHEEANVLEPCAALCPSCWQAREKGWVTHYLREAISGNPAGPLGVIPDPY